jgi:hypothetical protein
MRFHVNLLVGIAFFLLGVTIYLLSYIEAAGIQDWSLSPGFFPRLAATFIGGLSLLLILITVVSEGKAKAPISGQIRWRVFWYVIGTIAIMILYVSLIEWLGFIIATVVSMAGMMVLYGFRRWIVIALMSVGLPLLIYFFALKVMYVLFPTGKIFQ